MNNLKLALIEYARGRALIWDRNIVCTKQEREDAWIVFAEGFNLQVQEVRKRWEGMRRMYFHEFRVFLKTGKKSEWIYFPKLDSFLRKPVESLMEKLSVSKGTLNSECIELSSNDEAEESPFSYRTACKIVDEERRKKELMKESSSSKASEERVPSSKSSDRNLEKKVEAQCFSEPAKASSSASNNWDAVNIFACSTFSGNESSIKPEVAEESSSDKQDAVNIFACSTFSGNESSIKPEVAEESSSDKQGSKLPGPNVLLSRLGKQGVVLVSKTVASSGDKCAIENKVPPPPNSNTMEPDKNATNHPLKLMTTEDVRNELRKIPPIQSTLLTSRPLKPKYPAEADIGGIIAKHKHRAVSSSTISSNTNGSRSNKFRSAVDDKKHVASTQKARLPGFIDLSWSPNKPNKQKPCPLSKKPTAYSINLATGNQNSSVSLTSSWPSKNVYPGQDSTEGEECATSSLPHLPIAEDISEYATLNAVEDKEEGEPTEKKVKTNKRASGWFKGKMGEWRREACKLSKDKSTDSDVETNLETVRESRRNFLLSFLPDMDEMSAEQRKFFKSKLMNLVCHQ